VRPGNAHAGREFVGFNCDACHVVAGDQDIRPLISGYAPSFSEVANCPDTTPADAQCVPRSFSRWSPLVPVLVLLVALPDPG